ncbi:MAG: hypothetical protein Q8K37_05890, partial [Alphaproteobacteria bacterium]|nr:hypothetical protein [Alphaproteobacteria bacterium]
GRGEILGLQEKMRIFVNNEHFLALLHNFENETGNKLRELLNGYISNGWPVGLLNLMALTHEEKLENAIDAIFEHTLIDKDMPLTWMNLKKVLIKELINIKRQRINAIAEELTGQKHNETPHTIGYIEDLLGGAIGLRNVHKSPNFDVYMRESAITTKSLQEMLNLFHEDFTPEQIINHVNEMLLGNKFSIIEPETGLNIIWNMVSLAAKEQLHAKGIDASVVDLDMLFYNENGKEAIKLAMALLLTKLGILDEIDEHGNPLGNNNNIID